jgi:ATP-dependent 26S proteasome regulatory subunit
MKNPSIMAEASISQRLEAELDLRYLQVELARMDILIQRELHRWQLAGQNPQDAFRGLYISDSDANALIRRPLGTSWGQTISLAPEENQAFEAALERANFQIQELSELAHNEGKTPRLEQLAADFKLDRFDLDVLLICLAGSFDLRYERIYGYLQDDVTRKRPTVNLVLDLLCDPGPCRLPKLSHFAPDAPLFRNNLLEWGNEPGNSKPPVLSQTLVVDESITSWLTGRYQPYADLDKLVSLCQPHKAETDGLLLDMDIQQFGASLKKQPIIVLYGPDQVSQEAAARYIAMQSGSPLLITSWASASESPHSLAWILHLVLRDARLIGAIPLFLGWEVGTGDKGLTCNSLAELVSHPGTIILSGQSNWQVKGIERQRSIVSIEFPIPTYSQRRKLWEHFLGESGNGLDTSEVSGQFLLTVSQIRDAAAMAKDVAGQRGQPVQMEDLLAAAREHSSSHLASLARKITPRYCWKDIVLPDDQVALLREVVDTIRGRPLVLDDWGVGQKLASSRGITVLFAGPPGTGKTMAAEVIAGELGLDLYKIDLSTIVSKYIGETEKNLEHIFNEAESSNAILFFDEADALFGKRSEVRDSHDRYANIEISYLLQRMEAYDGVTILATNLRSNLDEAFTRRLQFAVDFPFPDEENRLRIWTSLFPVDVPRGPAIDFPYLARRYKLTGGSIRNIIVNAAYRAASNGGQVMMEHLLHGTRRELQKMGRLVAEEEFYG